APVGSSRSKCRATLSGTVSLRLAPFDLAHLQALSSYPRLRPRHRSFRGENSVRDSSSCGVSGVVNDESLRKVLKEWRSDAALPPRFQEAVWQRIESAQVPALPSWGALVAHWLGHVLPRPALAVAYVAMLLAVGGTAGWAQARQENARVKDE